MFNYLIADDEVLIRKGTLKKIERLALPITCVATVSNGQEAIDVIESQTVDFVVTDMDMPKVDGIGFLDYLQTNYPKMPVVVISGYQNFEYLQKAIQSGVVNYILKPFSRDEIGHSLETIIDVLTQQQTEKTDTAEIILKQLRGDNSNLGTSALATILSPNRHAQLIIIDSLHWPAFSDEAYFGHPIPDSQYVVGIIPNLSLNPNSAWGAICTESIVPNNAHQCYQTCIDMLNTRHYKQQGISTLKTTSADINTNPELPDKQALVFLIESGRQADFQEQFTASMRNFAKATNCPLKVIKTAGWRLVDEMQRFIHRYYDMPSNHTTPIILDDLMNQCLDFESTIAYLNELLGNIAESFGYEHLYKSDDVINNVKQFLGLHYREQISLERIADFFYVNASYLSTCFKQRTGQSFVTYLNLLRIQAAEKLLVTTDQTINAIAHQVGYENPKYFFRVFNQYKQQTPTQYRQRHYTEH